MERLFTCDPAGQFICRVVKYNDVIFIMLNVYGYNIKRQNMSLVLSIENILTGWLDKFPNATLLLGGDFNSIFDDNLDKWLPGQPIRANPDLKSLMDRFNLMDIWRVKFPIKFPISFTWINKTGSVQSRIDFWFISENFNRDDLTDHKAIYIRIKLSTLKIGAAQSVYWKLNSSLLLNDKVKKEVTRLISRFWSKAREQKQFGFHWELFKFEVGKFLRNLLALKLNLDELKRTRIPCLSQKTLIHY